MNHLLAHLRLMFVALIPLTAVAAKDLANASVVDTRLSGQALECLRQLMTNETSWPRIHAAEALLELDYPQGALRIIQEDLKRRASEPKYRIGLFRIMARQANGNLEREKWLRQIQTVFSDKDAPDRLHAVEALAKLDYDPQGDQRAEFIDVANSGRNPLALHAQWVLANSGDKNDQEALARYLNDRDEHLRGYAGYAFRFLTKVHENGRDILIESARKELPNSSARVYLVAAALTHSGLDQQLEFLKEIRSYAVNGTAEEIYEAITVLGRYGMATDLASLESRLKLLDAGSADIRVAAGSAILHLGRRMTHRLSALDWSVIVLYFMGMLAIGWYYSRKTKTSDDYLLGGRVMKPTAIGLSLFATLLSTVSYLAWPGEMIQHGPMILCQVAAYPIICITVGWLMIPYIMRLKVTSGYEILEKRLGVSVRVLGSIFFLSLRLLWMAVIIYATTTKAIIPIFGLSQASIPWVCAILGATTVVYTSMGGLRAVVVTDVVQTFILIAGAVMTLVLITQNLGGVQAWWPTEWGLNWDPPTFWFDSDKRTFMGAFLAAFVWYICTAGSDQMAIQRYLATPDVKSARRAFIISMVVDGAVTLFMMLLGMGLLAYFRVHPNLMPDGYTLRANADQLFPQFIAFVLPVGISGFVMAGLLAAAMSSLSSGVNSSSSVIAEDFVKRFRRTSRPGVDQVRLIRQISVFVGVVVVGLSLYVSMVQGNLLEVSFRVVNLFVAPMFVLFCMALFIPWATVFGTFAAAGCSAGVAIAIAYFNFFNLGFLWILPISLATGVISGMIASLLPIGKKAKQIRLDTL